MKNFDKVLPLLLRDEGGYSNVAGDNGGPTKYGITIKDVQLYVKKNATADDVKALTLDQAKIIYKSKYWDALSCDTLPVGVDYTCFDYGVNSGLGRPRKALQRFSNLHGTSLIDAINNERVAFLKAIGVGHNSKFLKGWLARVARVRTYSKTLAKNNTAGPMVGAGMMGIFASISQYWNNHEVLILSGGAAMAVFTGFLVHLIRNK